MNAFTFVFSAMQAITSFDEKVSTDPAPGAALTRWVVFIRPSISWFTKKKVPFSQSTEDLPIAQAAHSVSLNGMG